MITNSQSHNGAAFARRAALMLLLFATCLEAAAAEDAELWSWTETTAPASTIRVSFVRGDVEITRRPGPIVVEVQKLSASGGQSSVSIVATQTDTVLKIIDRYPDKSWIIATECLPPTGERGYFWDSDVTMRTKIWAPPETDITTHFMSSVNEYPSVVN